MLCCYGSKTGAQTGLLDSSDSFPAGDCVLGEALTGVGCGRGYTPWKIIERHHEKTNLRIL